MVRRGLFNRLNADCSVKFDSRVRNSGILGYDRPSLPRYTAEAWPLSFAIQAISVFRTRVSDTHTEEVRKGHLN